MRSPRLNRLPRQRARFCILERLEDRAVPAVFVVTTTADTKAVNLTTGKDANGAISLRSAIMAANATSGADTISLPAGTYNLTITGAGENAAATGDLDILGDLTINGAATATTIIDAKSIDRVFHIGTGKNVELSKLTLRNGLEKTGGGIFSTGQLTLTSVVVSGNRVTGANGAHATVPGASGASGESVQGGGIYNDVSATLRLIGSTVSSNVAQGGNGGNGAAGSAGTTANRNGSAGGSGGVAGSAEGGGIYNHGGTVEVLSGSNISSNSARGGNGGNGAAGGTGIAGSGTIAGGNGGNGGDARPGHLAYGGGIASREGAIIQATLLIEDSTIQANSVISGAGGNGGNGGAGGSAGNASAAGTGGRGGIGNTNGVGSGGGIFFYGKSVTVISSSLVNNSVRTGKYGSGGHGGAGGNANAAPLNNTAASGGNGGDGNYTGGGSSINEALVNAGGGGMTATGIVSILHSNVSGNSVQNNVTTTAIFAGNGGAGGTAVAGGTILGVGGKGGAGGGGLPGGRAAGGGLSLDGTVGIYASRILQNQVIGGVGGFGGFGGNGGTGKGVGSLGGPGGVGGLAYGGAVSVGTGSSVVAKMVIDNTIIRGNVAQAGLAGNGGAGSSNGPSFPSQGGHGGNGIEGRAGGSGGIAFGAGIALQRVQLTLTNSTVESNTAVGGKGGAGGLGGHGTNTVFGPPGNGGLGARGGAGGVGGQAWGGGLALVPILSNGSTAKVTSSTFVGNVAAGDQGGAGGTGGNGGTGVVGGGAGSGGAGGAGGRGSGGAIYLQTAQATNFINNTLEQNSVTASFGGAGGGAGTAAAGGTAGFTGSAGIQGDARGGALFHTGNGTATLINNTITRNVLKKTGGSLLGAGAGIFNESGPVSLLNTLIALNTSEAGMTITAPQVSGTFTSQGNNLIADSTGSTGFVVAGDLTGTTAAPLDAKLGLLANNGGPNKTVKLLTGSIAINAGKTTGAPTTDQRGFTRPLGGKVDIGAFEAE